MLKYRIIYFDYTFIMNIRASCNATLQRADPSLIFICFSRIFSVEKGLSQQCTQTQYNRVYSNNIHFLREYWKANCLRVAVRRCVCVYAATANINFIIVWRCMRKFSPHRVWTKTLLRQIENSCVQWLTLEKYLCFRRGLSEWLILLAKSWRTYQTQTKWNTVAHPQNCYQLCFVPHT